MDFQYLTVLESPPNCEHPADCKYPPDFERLHRAITCIDCFVNTLFNEKCSLEFKQKTEIPLVRGGLILLGTNR